jgi:hypothetical protein
VENILYNPKNNWEYYDFMINKYYWINEGFDKAYKIRVNNLKAINFILKKHKIKHFLFGQTLKGMIETGDLIDDHDEDFGVFADYSIIKSIVSADLVNMGFKLIRDTEDIISFERDFRYVDICFFKKTSSNKSGYANKQCKSSHFDALDSIIWKGEEFFIPNTSPELLEDLYSKSKYKSLVQKLDKLSFEKVVRKIKKIPLSIANRMPAIFDKAPTFLTGLLGKFLQLAGLKIVELTKEEFLNILVEPKDSFNWKWRARHLDIVTNDGEYIIVKDIVKYLENNDTMKNLHVEETNTTIPFFEPSNFDMRFWWGGNNYFIYCIQYQFRKNVVPYAKANKYIKEKKTPAIYTSEYYESLDVMNDDEIKSFLFKAPIEIQNNAVVGGKHRVFAMIGRLVEGKEYIPMRAFVFKNKA